MVSKRKVTGSILGVIGYILSPLSWWNDMFVNIPLATVFAWIISAFYHPAFKPALIVGYWLTNVAGFILMHKGAQKFFSAEEKASTKSELVKDVIVSLLYTALIVILVELGVLKPFEGYFQSKP